VHGGGAGPRSGNPDTVIAYNSSGNPTARSGNALTFDAYNQLTAYGSVMSAGYTGDGLRAWKNSSAGTPYFLYDGAQPVVEFNFGGAITAVNTFGPNGLLSRHSGSASTFYQFDPQGSVAQRLNSAGAVLSTDMYDAYGFGQSTGSPSDPWGYGAQWGYFTDRETGLLLLTHRYYDPSAGRFLNRDPMGAAGGLNLYGYTGNSPVGRIDPTGLDGEEVPLYFAQLLASGELQNAIDWAEKESGDVGPQFNALAQRLIQQPAVQTALQQATKNVQRLGPAWGRIPQCESFAQRVEGALEGLGFRNAQILRLVPTEPNAPLLVRVNGLPFATHVVVEYGNTIIDSLTGPKGLPFDQWAKLWKTFGEPWSHVYRLVPYIPGH
jgi:RHS repeat-associated protein